MFSLCFRDYRTYIKLSVFAEFDEPPTSAAVEPETTQEPKLSKTQAKKLAKQQAVDAKKELSVHAGKRISEHPQMAKDKEGENKKLAEMMIPRKQRKIYQSMKKVERLKKKQVGFFCFWAGI